VQGRELGQRQPRLDRGGRRHCASVPRHCATKRRAPSVARQLCAASVGCCTVSAQQVAPLRPRSRGLARSVALSSLAHSLLLASRSAAMEPRPSLRIFVPNTKERRTVCSGSGRVRVAAQGQKARSSLAARSRA
jgi:hypothetical protein